MKQLIVLINISLLFAACSGNKTEEQKVTAKADENIVTLTDAQLKNADVITNTANKQFLNGDINYLEWVLLINQAVTIQSDYIEAVKNRNGSAVEINSFITK